MGSADEAVHPYFTYMIGQAMISLYVSVVYLLHAILITDMYFSRGGQVLQTAMSDQDKNYTPIQFYVLGGDIHLCLSKYSWFEELSSPNEMQI